MTHEEVGHQNANPVTQMIWANTLLTVVLAVPSLTVMLLLRRKIGYRTIQPWMLLLAFMAMFMMGGGSLMAGFSPFAAGGSGAGKYLMLLAAFLVAGLGIMQRRAAWMRITQGERWHTKSRGLSHLAFLPFSEHIVQRFIEPTVCAVLGFLFLSLGQTSMGIWLLFSGLCLAALEAIIYDVQLNQMLDQLDGLVEAEVAAENAAFFSQPQNGTEAPGIEQMSGVTVGFAPELQHLVEKRRAAKAARQAVPGA